MSNPDSRWYYSVVFVLLALFVVLGPFGLPLLWKSPRFSRRAKGFLTVVMIAYTGALVIGISAMFQKILDQVQQLGGL